MRKVSGDGDVVLPWLLLRQDSRGNRYRVGSYATRAEAQRTAERLSGVASGGAGAVAGVVAGAGGAARAAGGGGGYLVERRGPVGGAGD